MIKYLGSKRQLLPQILECIKKAHPSASSVADLFSGTARVGHALKKEGYQVYSNDHNSYAYTLAQCYVEADLESVQHEAGLLIEEMNKIKGLPGYFTENFALKSRFFHVKNAERVDAVRDAIERKNLPKLLKSVLLVSLMEAADRIDSTCGIQMAYLKNFAKRAEKDLELRMPKVLPRALNGAGQAFCLEAHKAAAEISADVAYLDPPYNQHSYRGNYHIWETLVLWDKPEAYGVACKRVDCREKRSDFNSKVKFINAFSELIDTIRSPVVVVSFNNEGFVNEKEMRGLLSKSGEVSVQTIEYKRYVGAQIGIHNRIGEKVGKVSHLRNQEYLYVLDRR